MFNLEKLFFQTCAITVKHSCLSHDTEEISGTKVVKLGKILLRGNNIIAISFPEESE